MARPASLSLAMPKGTSAVSSIITSPTDARSKSPSLREARSINDGARELPVATQISNEDQPRSPDFTSLPPFPSSPTDTPTLAREPSKGFFSNLKASKSSNKVHHVEPTIRRVSEDLPRTDMDTSQNMIYSVCENPGSTPDLSLSTSVDSVTLEDRAGRESPNTLSALLTH